MSKEIWLNFPVKDAKKSREFFEKIGFELNEKQTNDQVACFQVGEKKTTVLFFAEEIFKGFAKSDVADVTSSAEVLISFDAANREEVDETARRVFEAGGRIFAEPAEMQGWMYGFAFSDLDGHRWNQVFMDFSKMPQS